MRKQISVNNVPPTLNGEFCDAVHVEVLVTIERVYVVNEVIAAAASVRENCLDLLLYYSWTTTAAAGLRAHLIRRLFHRTHKREGTSIRRDLVPCSH